MVNPFQGFQAILFDVDGVLVDTRRSYRQAIVLTVGKILKEKKIPEKPAMKSADVAFFKAVPGFNSDWAVARAAAAYYAFRNAGRKIALRQYCEQVRRAGGGLKGVRQVLRGAPEAEKAAGWLGEPDDPSESRLVRVFQEAYLGARNFEKTCGLPSESSKARGLIENETPLVPPSLFKKLSKKFKLAIVTGRPRFELDYVLGKWGVKACFQATVAAEDAKNGKPDPEPILQALKLLGTGGVGACYVGDSMDDALCAKAAGVTFMGVIFAKKNSGRMRREMGKAGARKIFASSRVLSAALANAASLKARGRK